MKEVSSEDCTIEAMELCRTNARRLLEDSKRTSEQTRSALLELSLEECGKAIVVFFHLLKHTVVKMGPERVKKARMTQADILSGIVDPRSVDGKELAAIMDEEFLRKTFKDHSVKLRALEAWRQMMMKLLDMLDPKKVFDAYSRVVALTPQLKQALEEGPSLGNLKDIEGKRKDAELRGLVEKLGNVLSDVGKNAMLDFDELKKMGFFVDYDRRLETFVYPRGLSVENNQKLERLTETLVQMIGELRFIPLLVRELGGVN